MMIAYAVVSLVIGVCFSYIIYYNHIKMNGVLIGIFYLAITWPFYFAMFIWHFVKAAIQSVNKLRNS